MGTGCQGRQQAGCVFQHQRALTLPERDDVTAPGVCVHLLFVLCKESAGALPISKETQTMQ